MPGETVPDGAPTNAWRSMLPLTIFMTAASVACILIGLVFLAVTFVLCSAAFAFITGYLLRSDEVVEGRQPLLPILRRKGPAAEPPS